MCAFIAGRLSTGHNQANILITEYKAEQKGLNIIPLDSFLRYQPDDNSAFANP